jgi:signal transduction histidine kinase
LRIVEQDSFNKTQFTENLIQALYYGGFLSILIYNLVQFFILRDKKYLLYTLFATCTGLAIFAGNGYGRIYLWPYSPDWDEVSQTVLFSLGGALAIAFTRHFFHGYDQLPKTNKLLKLISLAYFLLAALLISSIYFNIPTAPIYFIIFSLTLFSPALMILSLVRNILAKAQSASYFLLGWTSLWIGALVASLRVFNLIPSNTGTLYAMQISSGIEMLLFSLALAYRFQSERHKREITQKELLEAREETMQAMKLTGERLERAVETRTQKLQELLLSEQHMREQYVRFGAMIAHEFRNPLNIIQAQATMLEISQKNNQEEVLKRTSVIHSAIQRLVKLFDQWLESDRLSQENTQINKQLLTLSPFLSSLVNACHIYHPEHHLVLEPIPETLKIFGDDHLMQIAVLNLIDNACKYSPANSQVNIGVITDDYGIGIYVKDQGCGIASNMKEKILEPYFQVGQNDHSKGVGLGLAFVKRIMQAHDGRIEIQSEPNYGTTITLWLAEPLL